MGDLWALKGLIEEGMYRYFLLYLYVYQVRCRLFTIQLQAAIFYCHIHVLYGMLVAKSSYESC